MVSPRTRSAIRKAPIWLGVASPDMMMSNASRASSKRQRLPGGDLGDMRFECAHCRVRRPAPAAPPRGRRSTSYSLCSRATSWSSRSSAGRTRSCCAFLRHGVRPGAGRFEHLGHLEQDLPIVLTATAIRPVPPCGTPNTAATPALPISASSASRFRPRLVCFSSLSSVASVSNVRRRPSVAFPARRPSRRGGFGFRRPSSPRRPCRALRRACGRAPA